MTAEAIAAAVAVETLGATVQGLFGFGINLLAAPLLVLIDPRFAPGPVIVASLLGSAFVIVRGRGQTDRRAVGWALAGRVPGTALGALVVLAAAGARLRPLVGLVVLVAVAISVVGRGIQRRRATLVGVGVVSGVMNMVAGLGGAPFGLACQDMPGPVLRPTLASYVLAGGALSVAALAAGGALAGSVWRLTLVLLPGVVLGFGLSTVLVPLADRRAIARSGILVIATAGAIAAMVKGPW